MKKQVKKILYIAMLVMAIGSTSLVHAEMWGVHFLGTTNVVLDPVTGTAGVVPMPNWNNITNLDPVTKIKYTTGTIQSSDGQFTGTFTMTGATTGDGSGGWHSSGTGNGGDTSLADGYLDLGKNIPTSTGSQAVTNVITGLTGSSYTLYVYIQGDTTHPGNNGDWLPNYSANGIIYYAPQIGNGTSTYYVGGISDNQGGTNTATVGGPYSAWIKSTATLTSYNTPVPNTNYFGNYLEIDNVTPTQPGGVVTFVGQVLPNANPQAAWRSPLNGFELVLNTTTVAPGITAQTASATNFSGSTVQVQVVATGTPLFFQWKAGAVGSGIYTNLTNGGSFSGVTNATLTISNFSPANVGDYIVVITNSAGSVTSSVPTTLSVAPMTISGAIPTTSQVYPGASALFTVSVQGAQPLTYQWRKNGVKLSDAVGHISGSGTNLLQISNVGPTDLTSYDCVVTNSFNSVTSSPAILSETTAPVAGSYAQSVTSKGAVAYWRFNETSADTTQGGVWAYDFIGGRTGLYGASTQNGYADITGPSAPAWPGFEAANFALETFNNFATNSYVEVPSVFALNLNTNTVTITAWVNPTVSGIYPNVGLVCERQSEVAGLILGTNGNLGFVWNNAEPTYDYDSGLTLPAGQWSFVALVMTPTTGTLYMNNANGQTNTTLVGTYPSLLFASPLDIGTDTQDAQLRAFGGDIDEVAIFNRSLSNLEIAQLYAVGSGGPVPASISIKGSGANVVVTWTGTLSQSTNVSGPWVTNSVVTSPWTNAPTGSKMFYRAQ